MKNSHPGQADIKNPIRVMLADDHALVRAGIRALLERLQGIQVVAEAGTGEDALKLLRSMKLDVVLLDIGMPGVNGLDVLRQISRESLDVRVIVLTVYETDEYAERALQLGATGFLPKSAASSELERALKTVINGKRYLSSKTLSVAIAKQKVQAHAPGSVPDLTPRQREVLEMIANGQSTKDIARKLNLSAKTVETHRAQLMERLQIFDVAGLVRYAIRTGLVTIDD